MIQVKFGRSSSLGSSKSRQGGIQIASDVDVQRI